MDDQSLREIVISRKMEILGMFVARVTKDLVAPAPSNSHSELVDHLPIFLDDLVAMLDDMDRADKGRSGTNSDVASSDEIIESAMEHGRQRLRLGFDVEAVVREYGVLRECILEVAEKAGTRMRVRDVAALCRCLDIGTVNAVSEFTRIKQGDVERAVSAREEVLAIVAHDLRTPLNAVVMSAHLLASTLSPASREYGVTRTIHRAADEMQRMIADVLDLASIEAAEMHFCKKTELISVIVSETAESFDASALAKRVTLAQDVPLDLPPVTCDPSAVRRALANLIDNALKFTPHGGRIAVRAEHAEGFVRVEIADSGSGIPENLQERVFERHVRSSDPARRGVGLGLYIARGFIEACGGKVGVASRIGEGSTFWFTLPVADDSARG